MTEGKKQGRAIRKDAKFDQRISEAAGEISERDRAMASEFEGTGGDALLDPVERERRALMREMNEDA